MHCLNIFNKQKPNLPNHLDDGESTETAASPSGVAISLQRGRKFSLLQPPTLETAIKKPCSFFDVFDRAFLQASEILPHLLLGRTCKTLAHYSHWQQKRLAIEIWQEFRQGIRMPTVALIKIDTICGDSAKILFNSQAKLLQKFAEETLHPQDVIFPSINLNFIELKQVYIQRDQILYSINRNKVFRVFLQTMDLEFDLQLESLDLLQQDRNIETWLHHHNENIQQKRGKIHSLFINEKLVTSLSFEMDGLNGLRILNLSGNQMVHLPASIGGLPQLEELHLDGNQLRCLPPQIGQLSNLQRLYLSKNRFTLLPAVIYNFQQLQELFLHSNKLTEIPFTIDKLSQLQILGLQHNRLKTLPAELGDLYQLRELSLQHNELYAIPSTIGKLSQLQSLALDHNYLSTLPLEVYRLAPATELSLSNNPVTKKTIDSPSKQQHSVYSIFIMLWNYCFWIIHAIKAAFESQNIGEYGAPRLKIKK